MPSASLNALLLQDRIDARVETSGMISIDRCNIVNFRIKHAMSSGGKDVRSDADLLQLFAHQHDRVAIAAIVDRHGPVVLGICQSILRNEHDAADAFQATFLVLIKRARSIGKPSSLGSWLHGVAVRVAKRAKAQSMQRRIYEHSGSTTILSDPPENTASEETVELIHEEIDRLPERFRLPLILCGLEGETREDARIGSGGLSVRSKGVWNADVTCFRLG